MVQAMELRQLRYFAAVVEAGSLTAAAGQLHISQPPLSVAIAKLEADVGVRLLERTPRGVEPTSAGRYLLDASSRLLGEVDDIVSALGRFGAGLAGSLTLAAVPVLMWRRVPELVRAVAASAPDLELGLVDPPPWAAIELLEQRKVDLAAIMVADPRRFTLRHRDAMDVIDWGPIPLVAALPPDEADAPDPLPLTWFNDRPVLTPQRTAAVPSLPEAVLQTFQQHGITPSSLRSVDTIQASLPLIEGGVAGAILPDPDRASLGRFRITVRELSPQPKPLRALVLTRRGAASDPRMATLLAHVRDTGAH